MRFYFFLMLFLFVGSFLPAQSHGADFQGEELKTGVQSDFSDAHKDMGLKDSKVRALPNWKWDRGEWGSFSCRQGRGSQGEGSKTTVTTPTDTILECPSDTVLVADTGQCLVIFDYDRPSVVDDCGQNLDSVLTPVLISGLGPGGLFTVGTQIELYGLPQDSCEFTVTVLDEEPPVAKCKDITITLDNTGNTSIVPLQIDNFSTDNCQLVSVPTLSLNQTVFNTSHIGVNTVWLTVIDGSGNLDTCQATVTVIDPSVGLADAFAKGRMQVFPNPVRDRLTLRMIDVKDCLKAVAVRDLTGRIVYIEEFPGGQCEEVEIRLPMLSKGSYLLEVSTRQGLGRKVIVVD